MNTTYTIEEVKAWLDETEGAFFPDHSEHGIAAWKSRRDGTQESDASFLRTQSDTIKNDWPKTAHRMRDIADRLEALQKRVAELEGKLSDVRQSDRPNIGSRPDADGWIPHTPPSMPCDQNQRVHVRRADGSECDFLCAGYLKWGEKGQSTITHWRPVKPTVADVSKADKDGWIPHKAGDPMPCDGERKIDFKLRDGESDTCVPAKWLNWDELGVATITHWRPVKPTVADVSKADKDGWIPHKAGDPMPCKPYAKVAYLIFGDDPKSNNTEIAENLDWDAIGEWSITHWRPAK